MANQLFRLIFLSLAWITVMSCQRDAALRKSLSEFYGTEIDLPLSDIRCLVMGKDSIMATPAGNYTEVVYVDSLTCSKCVYSHLGEWNGTIKETTDADSTVRFIFILCPTDGKKSELYEVMHNDLGFGRPVYVDTAGVFVRANPTIPDDNRLHCFLLDKDRRVVMAGDPTHSSKIRQMMMDAIREHKTAAP